MAATQRACQREFGARNPPKRNTILGLVNKLETNGSLENLYNTDSAAIDKPEATCNMNCGFQDRHVTYETDNVYQCPDI
ncbi:hypothetical protein C0J52_12435 [Blattella germanica]|nr:hypothetical protein C0J52_12435 [Blattella germanica]